ncbi:MAG TPA: flavodoxin family protein [Opitutaceae bacterium]
MATVSVVYFSGTGTTALLADAIAKGARSVEGTQVNLVPINGREIVEGRWQNEAALAILSASDAIVFGTPTFMGGPAAQFKAFADATGGIWYKRQWRNKLAGGFTVSGSPSGDKLHVLTYLSAFAAQHAMTWINPDLLPLTASADPAGSNRLGAFLGVMAQSAAAPGQPPALQSGDAATGEAYGRRIATFAAGWRAAA